MKPKMEYNKSLKVIRKKVSGEVNITRNSQYNEMKAGKVTVSENVTARIYGTATTLILKKGSKVFLHGSVTDEIDNQGGELHHYKR